MNERDLWGLGYWMSVQAHKAIMISTTKLFNTRKNSDPLFANLNPRPSRPCRICYGPYFLSGNMHTINMLVPDLAKDMSRNLCECSLV